MSTRPDHALQDATRLRFLVPRPDPGEGLTVVRADLSAFFVVIERVGRNEALLLLLAKALRQRTGLLNLRVNDLAWILRVPNRRVIRWLDRLVRQGLVVYHVEDLWGIDTVVVEIVGMPQTDALRFTHASHADLPTHWFVQVLPLIGRTTFAVFLYFLWCEMQRPETHIDHLADIVRLRGRLHAQWHVRRLRARRLLVSHPEHGVIVSDPPPPSRRERLLLRFLAVPFLRRTLAHVGLLAFLVFVLLALLGILAMTSTPLP